MSTLMYQLTTFDSIIRLAASGLTVEEVKTLPGLK